MDRVTKAIKSAKNSQPAISVSVSTSNRSGGDSSYKFSGGSRRVDVDRATLKRNKVLSAMKDEGLLDAYKLLRTRLIQRMRQNNWTTLGVTSAEAKNGKTLTAINLGIALALDTDTSVIVVDTDLRSPSVHKVFGLNPDKGIVDFILDGGDLSEYLINPGIDRFNLLPCLDRTDGASELLSSRGGRALLELLRGSGDQSRIVIYDLPPVLVGDDVVSFSRKIDTMLMVVEDGRTGRRESKRVMELLEGVNIIGGVLNKSNEDVAINYY